MFITASSLSSDVNKARSFKKNSIKKTTYGRSVSKGQLNSTNNKTLKNSLIGMKTTISPHIEGKKVNFLPRDSIESINIQSESSGMPFSTQNDNKQSSIKYSTTDKESNSLSRDKNFLADSFKEILVQKMKPARHTKSSKSKRRRYTLCARKRAKPKIDTGINNSTKQIPKQIHKENAFSRNEMK